VKASARPRELNIGLVVRERQDQHGYAVLIGDDERILLPLAISP
jgi:hypothetical protein